MRSKSLSILWLRWIAANALGELFGLGMTFAFGAVIISRLGDQHSVLIILASFIAAVASGVFEATLVGIAQWWAMHPWFSAIGRRAWWQATMVGAMLAYVMGYLPSTLMSLGENASSSQTPMAEPEQWLVLLLAAGLGALGGVVLSFAQWLVLRGKVRGASIWIPANMLAWLFGMPLIFWGIDRAQKFTGLVWMILFMAVILFLTGLVVGAIHGAFLVRLAGFEGRSS